MGSFHLLIDGVLIGVMTTTNPITFDPSTSGTRDIQAVLFTFFQNGWCFYGFPHGWKLKNANVVGQCGNSVSKHRAFVCWFFGILFGLFKNRCRTEVGDENVSLSTRTWPKQVTIYPGPFCRTYYLVVVRNKFTLFVGE